MSTLNPAHHYSDVYDSLQQAQHMTWGDKDLMHYHVARLRLDTILARRSIIKDAELLNGIFFLSVTENSKLFRSLPLDRLEIRARNKSLEQSLLGIFVYPDRPTLRGIFFHVLPQAEAHQIRAELDKYPSKRVNSRKRLLDALRAVKMRQEVVEQLDR